MEKIIETERSLWGRSPVSWGAIFAGWLFAYAFALVLYLFGAAVGVTSLAALNTLSKGVAIGTGLWMVAAWVIATFVGAMIAARLTGSPERGNGMMHGMVVWALSGIMTIFMFSIQAAGAAAVTTNVAANAGTALDINIPAEVSQGFKSEFKNQAVQALASSSEVTRAEARQAIENMDAQTLTAISGQMLQGNTTEARKTLSDKTDLSDSEIDSIMNGLGSRAQYYQTQAKNTAGEAVEEAGDYTSASLWFLFIASLLGLGAGAWGGAMGAKMTARHQMVYAEKTTESGEYPSVVSYKGEERRVV